MKDLIFAMYQISQNCIKKLLRNLNIHTYSIYLHLIPVGRKSQVGREIQFCCQLGLALWHPSGKEIRQHKVLKSQPNLQIHKTDPLDTLGTHLQTQIDSFDLSPK